MTQINMYSSKEEIDAMTNKQAAEIISKFCSSGGNNDFSPRPHMAKANQLAVRALYKIDKLLEENTNLKKTINDLERENKNSYTSGYNRGYDDGIMHDTCEAYSSGYEDGYKAARSDK